MSGRLLDRSWRLDNVFGTMIMSALLLASLSDAHAVNLNQHGITGSWYNAATGGQGIEVEVYPDFGNAGEGLLFAGWFTFDVAAPGGQRWYVLSGNVSGSIDSANLGIYTQYGGNFNAPPALGTAVSVGQATLQLSDCTHGTLSYTFTDGRTGNIPLTRLTANVTCAASGDNSVPASDYLLSGNWFDVNTGGQGLIFDVNPVQSGLFAAWYTFAPNGQQIGEAASQRWYVMQAAYTSGMTSVGNIPIAIATGGVFDSPTPTQTVVVGTADIALHSCTSMTLHYAFNGGSNKGLTGDVDLSRVGPAPAGCNLLIGGSLTLAPVSASGLQASGFTLPAPAVSGGIPPYQFAFGKSGHGPPPMNAAIDASTGAVAVPNSAAVGFYDFQICAADTGGQTACTEVKATVNSAGPPTGLPSSADLSRQCAVPRAPGARDPLTGIPYNDTQSSLETEKEWIRSWVNETYLWYGDVPIVDAAPFVVGALVPFADPSSNITTTRQLNTNQDVVESYFGSQRSPLFTASGKPKDQFHFTYLTSDWDALTLAGNSAGFGFTPAILANRPPRKVVIAYTDPGTPATTNGLSRGAEFLAVNGADVVNGTNVDILNEVFFAPIAGKQYIFTVLDAGATASRDVTMTPTTITETPVQAVHVLAAPNSRVGYMLFNAHIATAESELVDAMNQLKKANGGTGIDDLILDIRYNGGGYVAIASELAYMIAGPAKTIGKTFERETFNDKQTSMNSATPFYKTTVGLSVVANQPLPHLDLPRVFVITTGNTCSASEAVINGLRGVGVTVIEIGGTTCGKPYGFIPQDNCSTTYFTIQFKGVNDVGFGDYADGFIPAGTGGLPNDLPGCVGSDDFTRALGDPAEALLAAALKYRGDGTCASSATLATNSGWSIPRTTLVRSPARDNRIYYVPTERR